AVPLGRVRVLVADAPPVANDQDERLHPSSVLVWIRPQVVTRSTAIAITGRPSSAIARYCIYLPRSAATACRCSSPSGKMRPRPVQRPLAFRFTLPPRRATRQPAAVAGLAQAPEDLVYASLWLSDHVVIPERIASSYPYSPDGRFPTPATQPYLEPLAGLGYLAGVTRRVRLGTHVLILPYRHPLLTAKMVATLDNLSGGRVDLGIGVGWMREEFEALGLEARV